ncbi:MAG: Ycf66 family protein [Cuspidothrix sp.]
MLTYLLALVVTFGSLAIYLAAFFFPEIHRQQDFIWSGVGLFYALVLWIFAPRITGGLLLGHIASVSMLVWFIAQTLLLRRQLTPEIQQTPVPSPELVKASLQTQISKFSVSEKLRQLSGFFGSLLTGARAKVQQTVSKKPITTTPTPEPVDKTEPTPTVSQVTIAETTETPSTSELINQPEQTATVLEVSVPESSPQEPTEPVIPNKIENVVEMTETIVEVTETEVFVAVETTIATTSTAPEAAPSPPTSN